jgi:acid phosphatase
MVPWFVTLGNHDHKGSVDAQRQYSQLSSRWRLPASYYTHSQRLADGSEATFFHLDTTPLFNGCGREQLIWLERELRACKAAWKIVVGHHPIYSGGDKHGDSALLIRLLEPLLENFGVQVYLNGHDHHLEHIVVGQVHYLTSGAGCKPRPAYASEGTQFVLGSRLGFLAMRLAPAVLEIEFVDDDGLILYRSSIPNDRSSTRSFSQPSRKLRLGRNQLRRKRRQSVSCGQYAG